jgi:hypothetical protein
MGVDVLRDAVRRGAYVAFEAETPSLAKLFDYWSEKAGERLMPARRDFDPIIEVPELTPGIFLVDIESDPPGFRYRLVGTEVADRYGQDFAGKRLDEIDFGDTHDTIRRDYEEAVRCGKPVYSRLQFEVEATNKLLLYERIVLPLSDDGETVNMLLCGAFQVEYEAE